MPPQKSFKLRICDQHFVRKFLRKQCLQLIVDYNVILPSKEIKFLLVGNLVLVFAIATNLFISTRDTNFSDVS